jgi:tetratricopeptide (TPR) repeat protein
MKKTLTAFFIIVMAISSIPFAAAETLSDVPASDADASPINYLYEQGVLKGYPDGTFRPRATVNRAELMKILVVGQGIEPAADTYKNCFDDVTDKWFAPYVCYAKEQGWVAGYPDGLFHPDKPVNRAEAAKMILNALGVKPSEASPLFEDVDASQWFAKYARTIKFRRLAVWDRFNGILGMTRAEVAVMLYRILVITQQDVDSFSENLAAGFDTEVPVDVIALKNRVVEETTEQLTKAKSLVDEGIQTGLNGDWETALGKFNSALIIAPHYAAAWAGKACSHYKLTQYVRARFAINTALILNPLKPIFYAIKSVVLNKLEMPKRAYNHLLIAAQMREKLNLTIDPLPATDTWKNYTADELVTYAEDAIEAWAWDSEVKESEWTEEYTVNEEEERAGEDTAVTDDDSSDDGSSQETEQTHETSESQETSE